jgi:hypothetical protein
MRTFSRSTEEVFVAAQIKAADFHTYIIYHREITNRTSMWVRVF